MLDTVRSVPTPEGIELSLRLAGPPARASALMLDLAIRGAILLALSVILGPTGRFGTGLVLIAWFFLEWLFPAVCEVYFGGATPGKKALGLVVLHDDGTPVQWPSALIRNLLRAVDFLPFAYGFGLASMLANRDFKRLGDIVAGTVVVYRDSAAAGSTVPAFAPSAPGITLSLAEQRAVLDYAERAESLTLERAEELAALATPLTGSGGGAAAKERLLRIANYLLGRKA